MSLPSLHFVTPFPSAPQQHILSDKYFVCEVPPHRAEQPSVCMYRGEMSRGDFNIRAPQVPANPQFFSLSQRCARPRAPPAPAGETLGLGEQWGRLGRGKQPGALFF